MHQEEQILLKIDNLDVEFDTRYGKIKILQNLSFSLKKAERVAIVGESGCGKSMTALALMGLLPSVGRVSSGKIIFKGENLVNASKQRLAKIRGNQISMIFQEPMTSLNPVFTIGEQVAEVIRCHLHMSRKNAWEQTIELFDAVKIPNAKNRVSDYPHQLSGGQRQRVMIAMALACKPEIIIADEPTTALDVTVQAEIFELLLELSENTKTAIILITHDIAVVKDITQKIIVMYAGRKIEEGEVNQVIRHPIHPYTQGLIACVPRIQKNIQEIERELPEIPGIVPSIQVFGKDACLFAPRCKYSFDKCWTKKPNDEVFHKNGNLHLAACWKAHELQNASINDESG